jgi:hypothetical protein
MVDKGHKSRRPKRRRWLPLLAAITAVIAVCTALLQFLVVIASLH